MLITLSPAKRLDWSPRPGVAMTTPDFAVEAAALARSARRLSVPELQALMAISPALAERARDQFRAFSETPEAADLRPAMDGFAGDTYAGLEAGSLDPDERIRAQDHLRILSGLYGVLRPLDGIQPYRLEMGSRLRTRRGATLYRFWGPRPAEALRRAAEAVDSDVLINCASVEYFSAVQPDALGLRVITPVFLEDKAGGPKVVSFFAKKARGAMARFILQNRITTPAGLLDFDIGGYRHHADLTETADRPVFLRADPAQAAA
jgi:cytoplasmic iron level regulating protein YaaA (DUF328/UPF0246 family)